MGEVELAGSELRVESGLRRVLLLVEDGADSEKLVGVHRRNRFAGGERTEVEVAAKKLIGEIVGQEEEKGGGGGGGGGCSCSK